MLSIHKILEHAAALERAGEWHAAIAMCEEAFTQSIVEHNVAHLIEAIRLMGYSRQWMGDVELAEDLLELALTLAALQADTRGIARALNGLSILHQIHGSLDKAEATYIMAREFAVAAEDELCAADISQNLGTLSSIRGDLRSALAHYSSALMSYEREDQARSIGLVLNNIGMLHIDLGEFDDAAECLARALLFCTGSGDVMTEQLVRINMAELFIELKELERTEECCDEAFQIATRLSDSRNIAEVFKLYGMLYRASGKPHLARTHLSESIAISKAHNFPLTEAEAQRELALVLRSQDRNRDSLRALNRSHLLFSQLRADREESDVAGRIDRLEQDFLSVVQIWGESIEAKDRYTRGHCQRVAEYACRIAAMAGVPKHDLVWFRMGAFLHDVGKTEIPESILNKAGSLSDAERSIMERHTIIGEAILHDIPFPWEIRPMVRSHHERWDGRGYPDGLSGNDIPITARILRLADIFDALTTARSYREPVSAHDALQLMEDDHGSFDPELFQIFRSLLSTLMPSDGAYTTWVDHPGMRTNALR